MVSEPPHSSVSRDLPPTQLVRFASAYCRDRSSGFIVADLSFKPLYANEVARDILTYCTGPHHVAAWEAFVQERLRLILQITRYTSHSRPPAAFVSGRRLYICRSFLLNIRDTDTQPPLVALLMERSGPVRMERGGPVQAALHEVSRQFHLSPRESETVLHLTQGLTTKEIAQRMRVSPNTIKQFVRLIMSKMRVTTRSGILGKLLGPI